jgi:hypothetical protein
MHSVTVRNSFNIFKRGLEITPSSLLNQYRFRGKQLSSFSEVAYTLLQKQNVLITGINFYTDDFKEDRFKAAFCAMKDIELLEPLQTIPSILAKRYQWKLVFAVITCRMKNSSPCPVYLPCSNGPPSLPLV